MSNTRPQARRPPGFTITELIVVVIIIGVLAAIAFPQYRVQINKMKNQEAIRVLMAVWEAQKEYYRENGAYFEGNNRPAINNNLDLAIPPLKYFTGLTAEASRTASCTAGNFPYLAKIKNKDNSYTLKVLEDGRIVCHTCNSAICLRMGFKNDW